MLSNKKVKAKHQKALKVILLLMAYGLQPMALQAQCAMCRASLESTGDVTQAEAVNNGIIYLMVIPYILVGLVGFYIYKMFVAKKKQQQ